MDTFVNPRAEPPSGVSAPINSALPRRINGLALHAPGEILDDQTLRERACGELLRQHAVHLGLLPKSSASVAPALKPAEQRVIEDMTEREVISPIATDAECRRYYAANKLKFTQGQARHLRHILFAVTPGVNVPALRAHAQAVLAQLLGEAEGAPAQRFVQLAGQWSNCPSGAQGGDLGWIGPGDCAPELAQELFFQADSRWTIGVYPRLVHTRYGFHIIEGLAVKQGVLPSFEQLEQGIRQHLQHQSRTTALRQYLRLLAEQAKIEGIALEGSASSLLPQH